MAHHMWIQPTREVSGTPLFMLLSTFVYQSSKPPRYIIKFVMPTYSKLELL